MTHYPRHAGSQELQCLYGGRLHDQSATLKVVYVLQRLFNSGGTLQRGEGQCLYCAAILLLLSGPAKEYASVSLTLQYIVQCIQCVTGSIAAYC